MIDAIVHSASPVLLVGGGELDKDALRAELSRFDKVVAADGGADAVLAAGGRPDALIGDLDSVSEAARAALPAEAVHEIAEQDSTDFDKCLRNIAAPLVVAMGFLGARVDHQLAAFTVLAQRAERPCLLIGAHDAVALCPPELKIGLPRDTRVSLWPLAEVTGRSDGLHWPIAGMRFAPHATIGTSNRAEGPIRLRMDAPGMLILLPARFAGALAQALMAAPRWGS
ncbi:thiamine diphosphokinase [Roseivivax sp. GX 12232]|uniref:thiamine diphosphokinase n=1 Tax=Roseivivax sp. GX 12232 TaxID=2900547 RepID=UPI001E2B91A6|nr:thiamine diphosphokinase [Roseivivax sp. GX 12232]MCE0505294.1 thiamine diphosphokinase [Roseivivax sp. GX 12232]